MSSLMDVNAQRQRIQKRTLRVVTLSQACGGAGLTAGISVGALIAQDMLGTTTWAGLPTAFFTVGAALTAFLVGRATQTRGRRLGLSAGFTAGGVGAVAIIIATQAANPLLFFVALCVYGAGTATNLQARYAGTDLAAAEEKGRAVSVAMVATTFGAVAGPNLVGPMSRFATGLGLEPLTGPFMLAAVAYLSAGLIIFFGLRPDPFLVAQKLEREKSFDAPVVSSVPAKVWPAVVIAGAVAMVVSQFVMTSIMAMTPVHMRAHHHGLEAVGIVIALHVAAMWLPSLVTGRLVDQWGARALAMTGGVVLLVSGMLAAFASSTSLGAIIVALILLGLGWNMGIIAGTTMVVTGTPLATRAATQGRIDVVVNITAALAGLSSGVVMGATSFGVLATVSGIAALIIVPMALLAPRSKSA